MLLKVGEPLDVRNEASCSINLAHFRSARWANLPPLPPPSPGLVAEHCEGPHVDSSEEVSSLVINSNITRGEGGGGGGEIVAQLLTICPSVHRPLEMRYGIAPNPEYCLHRSMQSWPNIGGFEPLLDHFGPNMVRSRQTVWPALVEMGSGRATNAQTLLWGSMFERHVGVLSERACPVAVVQRSSRALIESTLRERNFRALVLRNCRNAALHTVSHRRSSARCQNRDSRFHAARCR